MAKALAALIAVWLALSSGFALAWTSDGAPTDPVLSLHYPMTQSAFPKMPAWMMKACTQPSYGGGWIFASAKRREGEYVLLYGPVWVTPDQPGPLRPELVYDTNGAIALITRDGRCEQLWDADNAFDYFFPGDPHDEPTVAHASIVQDLAANLLQNAVVALGGREKFLHALAINQDRDGDLDRAMIPLVARLRASAPIAR